MSTDHRQRAEGIEASKNPIVQQAWSKIHHAYTLEAANQIDFPECTRRVALAISEALAQSLRAREGCAKMPNPEEVMSQILDGVSHDEDGCTYDTSAMRALTNALDQAALSAIQSHPTGE